jgi:hypothetical protein
MVRIAQNVYRSFEAVGPSRVLNGLPRNARLINELLDQAPRKLCRTGMASHRIVHKLSGKIKSPRYCLTRIAPDVVVSWGTTIIKPLTPYPSLQRVFLNGCNISTARQTLVSLGQVRPLFSALLPWRAHRPRAPEHRRQCHLL